MQFKRYNISRFFILALCFLFWMPAVYAFVSEDINIGVRVVNDRTGVDVAAEVKAFDVKTNKPLKIGYANSEWLVSAVQGQKIKISAVAEGFYTEDKILDADATELVIRLSPRPMAVLVFKVVDDESKNPMDAEVQIFYKDKIFTIPAEKRREEYRLPLLEAGAYKVVGKARGFMDEISEMEVNVTDPPNVFMLNLFLKKAGVSSVFGFYDKLTSEKVLTGDITVKQKKDGKVIYQGPFKDGKLKVETLKNEPLLVEVKAKGYLNLKDEVRYTGVPLSLAVIPETVVDIDIFDDLTSKRIVTDLTITSPSKKVMKFKSSAKESFRFVPAETGAYLIQSYLAGYDLKSGSLTITTLGGGNSLFSMKLNKVPDDYVISVFDEVSKSQIREARIKVFDENRKEVNMSSNLSKLIIDPAKKYSFDVTADGYEDFSSPISENKRIEVYMKKKVLPEYNFVVIDSETRQPIPESRFRIFDAKNTPFPASFDPATKKYSARLGNNGPYSMEASAKGYMNFKGNLSLNSTKEITISLSPVASDSYTFQAVDAITGDELPASFRLTMGGVEVDLAKSGESKTVKASLSPLNAYEIEASMADYGSYKTKVSPQGLSNGIFKIVLKKDFYKAGIFITNSLTDEELSQVNISASLPNITTVKLVSEGRPPIYFGEFKPDAIYNISVSLKGYELFTDKFLLSRLNPQKLIMDILLVPLRKEVKKEAEPVKVQSKEVADLPDHLSALNSEFTGKEILGKTYRLNKVNFEKSKPKMLDGSSLQLDLLAAGLSQNKNLTLEITGHTDSDGNDQRLNQYLSEFRAKVIANYLFNKGIDNERITVKGKGSSEPLVPNDSDENKAKNRRVEVRITGN